ncbi:hypothetical protein J1780_04710 [Rahnella aceris]|uniref:fimbrial protein n=1 Tax=Rahnella sp. (strain Y9602) TaxID=2703885 RepID=UPI001C26BFCA|nr:fimbrial protein [Rahnella aceris]MBU9839255.1 hypothetical protein [Rahnella aceris]
MSKKIIASLVAMVGIFHFGVESATAATDGTLTLNSNITPATCFVSSNNMGGNSGGAGLNQTVVFDDLDSIVVNGLSAGSDAESAKPISFHVQGCPQEAASADVKFDYTEDAANGTSYIVATGGGKGISFAVSETQTGALLPTGGKLSGVIDPSTHDGDIGGFIRLLRNRDTVTSGPVTSMVNLALDYN